jgi:hypothetical protein
MAGRGKLFWKEGRASIERNDDVSGKSASVAASSGALPVAVLCGESSGRRNAFPGKKDAQADREERKEGRRKKPGVKTHIKRACSDFNGN